MWLLSAYRSDSHASWVNWLTRTFENQIAWRVFELPGRYFRWRIRGNPLSWLDVIEGALSDGPPSHIIATSMVDIATLKGLHPELADVPVSLYFHENQFAYPVGDNQHSSVDPLMVQLYGALAAQNCFFNSDYNRDSMLAGVAALMKKLPDEVPAGVVDRIAIKSSVLPVPVDSVKGGKKHPGLILWNHRWEYDKRPDLFESLLVELDRRQCSFSLALLGPRPGNKVPEPLAGIRAKFADCIVADGRVSREEYETLLAAAAVVVSTADHEFQGLSMIEAVSAGAVPVVPDALCYREQYPADCRYVPGDVSSAADRVEAALDNHLAAPDIRDWTSARTATLWSELLNGLSGLRQITGDTDGNI